jgi:IS5 family transposase
MRKVIELQMEFWKKDIASIEFDLQSRDEIPKLLMGLQYIYFILTICTEYVN